MRLFEITNPSKNSLLESVQTYLGITSTEQVAEHFKNMKFEYSLFEGRRIVSRHADHTQSQKVYFRASKDLFKSMNHYKSSINGSDFHEFFTGKLQDPTTGVGSKDYPYTQGPLKGIMHHALSRGFRLLYTTERDTQQNWIFNLAMVATHDDTGTGTPPKINKQRATAVKVDNMAFLPSATSDIVAAVV